jgi:Na+/glutamate symporter
MSSPTQHAVEQAAINISGKVGGAGTAAAVGSGVAGQVVDRASQDPAFVQSALTIAELGVIVGICLGIIGYLTQVVFQLRRDRRESVIFKRKMERLGDDSTP